MDDIKKIEERPPMNIFLHTLDKAWQFQKERDILKTQQGSFLGSLLFCCWLNLNNDKPTNTETEK